jgi:hypothetical protein
MEHAPAHTEVEAVRPERRLEQVRLAEEGVAVQRLMGGLQTALGQVERRDVGPQPRQGVRPASEATSRVERPLPCKEVRRQLAVLEELVYEPRVEPRVPGVAEASVLEVERALDLCDPPLHAVREPRDAAKDGKRPPATATVDCSLERRRR